MGPEKRTVKCPFPECEQLVSLPPTFDDTWQCACGAKYHYEFGDDLGEEIAQAEEERKEWKYIFIGVATNWDQETGLSFDINYDAKEEYLFPHEDKIYLFFTRQPAGD